MEGLEKLGQTAAVIMGNLETETEVPDNAEIVEVMIIAAVAWETGEAHEDGDKEMASSTYYRCTSDLPWIQVGLLEIAREAIEHSKQSLDEDE